MDFVARAKALMEKQARTVALVILPLAAAVAAQATQVAAALPTGNTGCTFVNGGTSACSAGTGQLPDPGNGLLGVKFFTSGPIDLATPSGSGSALLLMQTSGVQNASFNGTIPLSYVLAFTGNITSWSLNFNISQTGGPPTSVASANGSGSGTFSGIATFPSAVSLTQGLTTNVNFLLSVAYIGSGASINIPPSSVDFNANAAVPEPTSAALLGLGLALVGGWRLRRRFVGARSRQ